ncbi:MAG: hypothetical protein Q8P22_00150 [Chloroflexota bacterium]|nr:hypothetical protein [Chloroflexota bacterium]
MIAPARRVLNAIALAGIAVIATLVASWIVAFAQYPPPVGSVTTTASNTSPATGASVTVTCTVLDTQGNPVANEPCTFTIVSQPGTDATLDGATTVTKTTNAQGKATAVLSAGSAPGQIVVSTGARGIASQVTVSTQAAAPAPAATLPPGAVPGAAPPTGGGSPGDGGQPLGLWIVVALAGTAAALASLVVARGVARRPKTR